MCHVIIVKNILAKKHTHILVLTHLQNEANNVNFYSEIVKSNNDKKLITLVKKVEENCRQQNKYLDWIKLVWITPIINDEIEDVVDDYNKIDELYSNKEK